MQKCTSKYAFCLSRKTVATIENMKCIYCFQSRLNQNNLALVLFLESVYYVSLHKLFHFSTIPEDMKYRNIS